MDDGAIYDLLVVGGGINGSGIARDAAGRGLKVLLCEQGDLAEHTSSASTKLIHGGLRYLEHYEFRLVRKALKEREVLLHAAPHIIWPMRFIMPHAAHLRPRWLIRLGLFLYDHLGGRTSLPGSRAVDLEEHEAGAALLPEFTQGYAYSDCWVQDSRLVVLNALDAAERGADVRTRTACLGAERSGGLWRAALQDRATGCVQRIRARAIANAAGPWVGDFLGSVAAAAAAGREAASVRLIKGSHLVVKKLFDHDHAYLLQTADARVIFVIPYETDYTLIGTTDQAFEGDPSRVEIDEAEITYLCATVNGFFRTRVAPEDVVWSYAGVRPLYDDDNEDASAITRDYRLQLDGGSGEAPLLSVFGGKITTYRTLAEEALQLLEKPLGCRGLAWTATATLPGGDLPGADFERWLNSQRARYAFLPESLLRRYARNYGTRMDVLIGSAGRLADLGRDLGGGIHVAELEYLVRHEWARTAADVLWRRSRMGLHVGQATAEAVEAWFCDDQAAASPTASTGRV